MKNDKKIEKAMHGLEGRCIAWRQTVQSDGNQTAYSDSMIRGIIENVKILEALVKANSPE